jgi:hypothetical protein
MTATLARKPAAKKPVARSLRWQPAATLAGVPIGAAVTLTVGRDCCTYGVREIPCAIGGVGFELVKLDLYDDQVYHVRVGEHGAECDCAGGTYGGKCKHGDAVVKMIELGHLSGPAAKAAVA